MLDSVFYVLLAAGVVAFLLGFVSRTPPWVMLSGIIFILCGTMLLSGVSLGEQEITITQANGDGTYTITEQTAFLHTIDTDEGVNMLSQILFYGGFGVVGMTLYALWNMRKGEMGDGI